MNYFFACLFFLAFNSVFAQDSWSGNTTPSYPESINYLKKVAQENNEIELYAMGPSDYGLPIYICFVNGAGDSLKTLKKAREESTILINNAIHPGEPDGVNAMLIWIDTWIKNGKNTSDIPLIAFIPAYNVGGMMNRSSTSRANQNGPEEYGFRGNAKNLDLNRDFIKMDSQNAFTFATIFHALDPDVFIDMHVSNGADYQYTLTYISSMKERMAPEIRNLCYSELLPYLRKSLKSKKIDLFPYVELKGETPAQGIYAFNDLPRYAMGYASLFNSLSFTVETHMLKPFPERVQASLAFMEEVFKWTFENQTKIELSRKSAFKYFETQDYFKFNYKLTEKPDSILFLGFEHDFPIDETTGLKRLRYDRTKPYARNIPHFANYFPQDSIRIPEYYVVGAQEKEVIERLKFNKIYFTTVSKESSSLLNTLVVKDYKSLSKPYEGHFKLSEIEIKSSIQTIKLKPGDILIPSKQKGSNFIHSVLQGRAEDSYLSWNFFDSYLQQKEYFSNYVFIEQISQILKENPQLKKEYEEMKAADEKFRNSEWDQLYFIYCRSPYFEQTFMRLPIYYK